LALEKKLTVFTIIWLISHLSGMSLSKEEIRSSQEQIHRLQEDLSNYRAEFFNKTQENQLEEMKGEIEKKILW
jgi:hypothetical protein